MNSDSPTIDIHDPAKWRWSTPLQPRNAADTSGRVAELLAHLERTGQDQLILRLVANSPNLFRPFVLMADGLVNQATLPANVREAVVLHLALELDDAYEWHSHVDAALEAGVTPEQIEELRTRSNGGSALDEGQRVAIRLVMDLRAGAEWSEASWQQAIEIWGLEGAFDLLLSAGWWAGLVPLVLRGMGVAPRA